MYNLFGARFDELISMQNISFPLLNELRVTSIFSTRKGPTNINSEVTKRSKYLFMRFI